MQKETIGTRRQYLSFEEVQYLLVRYIRANFKDVSKEPNKATIQLEQIQSTYKVTVHIAKKAPKMAKGAGCGELNEEECE